MSDNKKYYKLDDIGIIGKQEKKTAASLRYDKQKTGEAFRQSKISGGRRQLHLKKVI